MSSQDPERSALADGLYWYAEKLMWGYEDVTRNESEAVRLYRRAEALGHSDAAIRVGQCLEFGRGVDADPNAAITSYKNAAKAGNFFALAFLAQLVSRTTKPESAQAIWSRFFEALDHRPDARFLAASVGELLHGYIETQLRLGQKPEHVDTLRRYRLAIVTHHQQLLEHASDVRLQRLNKVLRWITADLQGDT